MSGIFANQFSYANAYNPVGLDTGTPQVGATVGNKRPRERNTPEPVPSRVRSGGNESASESAALGQSLANGMGGSAGLMAGQGAGASQGSLNSLSNMVTLPTSHASTPTGMPWSSYIDQPVRSGADATTPQELQQIGSSLGKAISAGAQAAPHPSLWGDITGGLSDAGNFVAHQFDNVRHGVASGADFVNNNMENSHSMLRRVLNFGMTPPSTPTTGPGGGLIGIINQATGHDPSVIEPSNVYNPARNAPEEIGQGSPKIIQGQVEGNPSIDVAAPGRPAINSASGNLNEFIQQMRNQGYSAGDEAGAASSAAADVAPAAADAAPSIWDSLGSAFADAFGGI